MNEIHSEAAAAERIRAFCRGDCSYSLSDVKALIERFPNAVRVRDDVDGYLPLHSALTYGLAEVVPILVEAWLNQCRFCRFVAGCHCTLLATSERPCQSFNRWYKLGQTPFARMITKAAYHCILLYMICAQMKLFSFC